MADLTGQTIRGYELKERIGAGGFGAVYRAYQPIIGREVAVKIILPRYANQPDFIRRFEFEAHLIARLEHIHIVPLYDYWREPSGAYLVMRWLRGGSLRNALRQRSLSLIQTSQLLEQITSALHAAHRRGVIHRDLKPDNILLDDDGNAYLADFGIAKDLGRQDTELQSEDIVGSPAYISPEQIQGKTVTPQTDIYSLGIMLYEILTGEVPFYGQSPTDTLYSHVYTPIPNIQNLRPDLPTAVNNVIHRATAKIPEQRYPDAPSLAADFRQTMGSQNAQSLPPLVVSASTSLLRAIPGTPDEVTLAGDVSEEVENPYKGLRAFQEADAVDFFGREALVEQLLLRFGDDAKKFLAVVGPSGSGKSSVVRAGVIPALRRGALPGSERWFIVEMIPGEHPVEDLETALLRVSSRPLGESLRQMIEANSTGLLQAVRRILPDDGESELVLFIDQFEEIFTLLDDAALRNDLLDNLLAAATEPESRLRVIITLRADFYDRPLMYPGFGDLVRKHTEVVLPMSNEELERAIVGPAARVNVALEPGLAAAIVADVGEQPGALPLLQYALTELFERREGNVLTVEAYRTSGGVLGALARRADELYLELTAQGQEAARQLFLRLVTLGEGTEDTRRRVLQTELLSDVVDSNVLNEVIETYSKYRLLTLDRDQQTRSPIVEVAHEALIRTWQRLRIWIDEVRDDLRLQRRLTLAASEWISAGRDASFLASGTRLDELEAWAAQTTLALSQEERTYLEESITTREALWTREEARKAREAMLEIRSRSRLRTLLIVFAIATVASLGMAAFALNQQQIALNNEQIANANAATSVAAQKRANANAATAVGAQQQADNNAATAVSNFEQSESLRLAAEANLLMQAADGNAETAALLSVRALQKVYSPQGDEALARATTQNLARRIFTGHTQQISGVAFSPDGRHIITGSHDGTARLWDVQSGAEIRQFRVPLVGEQTVVWAVDYSPDGRYILTSSAGAYVTLWNAQTGEAIEYFAGHTNEVNSLKFSPDGKYILTGSADSTAKLWEIQTRVDIRQFVGHSGKLNSVGFSADGKLVVTAADDMTARVWDAATGKELRRFEQLGGAPRATISPDGKYVLAGSTDSVAQVWDVATGKSIHRFTGSAAFVAFSPDGKSMLTSTASSVGRLWDVATGDMLETFAGHNAQVSAGAFSHDGQFVLIGNQDNSVRLWEVRPKGKRVRQLRDHTEGIADAAYSSDGKYLLTTSSDKTARLWDAASRQTLHILNHPATVSKGVFSPDGKFALTASLDGTIRLWDIGSGKEIRVFTGHTGAVYGLAFSPNGSIIASGADDKTARLWDTATGQEIRKLDHPGKVSDAPSAVWTVAYSPDGRYVLTSGTGQILRLWDAGSGREVRRLQHGHTNEIFALAFSPDGRYVLSGSLDRTVRLLNVETGKEERIFTGHTDIVFSVAFSPDAKLILTSGSDKTARLWDLATGKSLRTLVGHNNWVRAARFSPDGKQILTASNDATARLWDVDYHDTVEFLCAQLIREFTPEEREQYTIRDKEPTCPAHQLEPLALSSNPSPVPPGSTISSSLVLRLKGHSDIIWSARFSSDGKFVVTGSKDKTVRLWDVSTGRETRSFTGISDSVQSVAFSPDNKTIAAAVGSEIVLWNAATGDEIRRIAARATIASITFTPDGKFIAAAHDDKIARLWDMATGQESRQFVGHTAGVQAISVSADGRYILTGSPDKTVRLWDAATGQEIRQFTAHGDAVLAIAFSPDGSQIATGGGDLSTLAGGDNAVRVWDLEGRAIREITGHTGPVTSLAFSPDGKYLLVATTNRAVRLWDVSSGQEVRRFSLDEPTLVLGVGFSPDGKYILTNSYGPVALLWHSGLIAR